MERAYRAALACLPEMNPLSLPKLIRMAGGAEELWRTLRNGGEKAAALVGWEKERAWRTQCRETDPGLLLESLARAGIRVIIPGEECLPAALWSIYDPPAVLFCSGRETPSGRPWVAIVGARKATGYGKRCAEHLAGELGRCGVVVVSGAAYGIDAQAHRGCLQAGGFTVAVLGCGIDRIYPPEHAGLLEAIKDRGCLLSEYPPGADPLPWRFPHRNRLIAGLCQAVLVVEATEKSGALITAEYALEEGREVLAVPGLIDNPLTRGTHSLIQSGAKLVASVEDILEELPPFDLPLQVTGEPAGEDVEPALFPASGSRESVLLEILREGPATLDVLARLTGEPAGPLLETLTGLHLKGWICQEPGGKYVLAPRFGA